MKTIKIKELDEIPDNFTGIAEYSTGTKAWYKEGKFHREDGPAIEWSGGSKFWYLNGLAHRIDGPAKESRNSTVKEWRLEHKEYTEINLKDYLVLDYFEGKYGLMWYKLLDKDKVIEYPDIPGLIIK